MGPSIASNDAVPDFVEVPEGVGTMVVEGRRGPAGYEPFTPSSYYYLVDLDMNIPITGTYYVAVYDLSMGGRYGLAVGYREAYGLDEWIRVPIDVIGIHQWEGQSLGFILAPLVVIVVIGLGLSAWRNRSERTPLFGWIGSLAGLLYIGSGAMIAMQMFIALTRAAIVPEVVVTVVFTLMPILIGILAIRFALRSRRKITVKTRVYMFILGILAVCLGWFTSRPGLGNYSKRFAYPRQ